MPITKFPLHPDPRAAISESPGKRAELGRYCVKRIHELATDALNRSKGPEKIADGMWKGLHVWVACAPKVTQRGSVKSIHYESFDVCGFLKRSGRAWKYFRATIRDAVKEAFQEQRYTHRESRWKKAMANQITLAVLYKFEIEITQEHLHSIVRNTPSPKVTASSSL